MTRGRPPAVADNDELTRQVTMAMRRREKQLSIIEGRRRVIAYENAIREVCGWLTSMGAGHIPSEFPTLADVAGVLFRQDSASCPSCRNCGVPVASISGQDPCPGDTRKCQTEVPDDLVLEGVSFKRYQVDTPICGRPGKFEPDFTGWTCTAGHVTTRSRVERWRPLQCSADGIRGCIGECPSYGLNETGVPATTVEQIRAGVLEQIHKHRPPRRDDRAAVERVTAIIPYLGGHGDMVRRALAGEPV